MPASARGRGEVKIARLDSDTAYTLGTSTGPTRVVWVAASTSRPSCSACRPPRRQPLTGRSVSLLRLSAPLADNEDSC